MKRLIAVLACSAMLASAAAGQTGSTPVPGVFNGITLALAQPPQPVSSATGVVQGNPGPRILYYWIVTNALIGSSAPAGPFIVPLAPNTLSASSSVSLSWSTAPGAITYDVLRTTSPAAPVGACNCAVATAIAGTTASDQSNTLGAYTVAQFDPNTLAWTLSNQSAAANVSKLSLAVDGVEKWSIDSTGVQTSTGLNAKTIEQVRYADQFPGTDIGAKVNAAIAALPNGCGTVMVPAGTYDFSTMIIKPRCALLRGQSGGGTTLTWTSNSGTAVAVGDSGVAGLYAPGGVLDLKLVGPGTATTAVGMELGGDPNGVILPAADHGDGQNFTSLVVTGFNVGVLWGNHAWLENFYRASIHDNQIGITEPSAAITDSLEQNAFFGGAVFNNAGGGLKNCNNEDLAFFGTSFDFNGADTLGNWIYTSAQCYGCHFEEDHGPQIDDNTAATSVTLVGGKMVLDSSTITTGWEMRFGGSGSSVTVLNLSLSAGDTVSELVDWLDTSPTATLSIAGLKPADSFVQSTFQPGFAPSSALSVARFDAGLESDAPGGVVNLKLCDKSGGDATPCKFIRVNGGILQLLNNAYGTVIASFSDSGNFSTAGSITAAAAGLGIEGATSGETIFQAPATGGGTLTAPQGSGTLTLTSQLPLSATTASIGGAALAAGACTTGTVAVASSTTSMAVAVSPAADPGAGFDWQALVGPAGTVTVRLCNITSGSLTPTAETYNVRVIQ